MRHHQHALAVAHHLGRLAKDQFDQPRVLVHLGGELLRPRRRRHAAQIDDASFGLRHDLLGDDDYVAALAAQGRTPPAPLHDQVGDVVARLHQRNPGQRRNAQLGGGLGVELFGGLDIGSHPEAR